VEYEELRELLQFNDKDKNRLESTLFMPNEIFKDLNKGLNEFRSSKYSSDNKEVEYINVKGRLRKKRGKSNGVSINHITFAYSYIYLVTWLYRYAKYGKGSTTIKKEHLKMILGYGAKTQEVDYLIKKNGVLEKIGYLETTGDYPIDYHYSNRYTYEMYVNDLEPGEISFTTFSEFKEKDEHGYLKDPVTYDILNRGRNYKVKYPVKAFDRLVDEEGNIEMLGTFYEVDNTHLIPFEVFLYCMSNKDIGCTGFYLWSYLKMQNQIFENGYDVSILNLSIETGIPDSTLNKYIGLLKSYKMINFYHNQEAFSVAYRDEDRKANTYETREYFSFSDKPVPYEKIKVVTKEEYLKQLKEKEDKQKIIWGNRESDVDIPHDQLPY
jgi:hypothetical protein